jgi:hypothetical protein
MNPYREKFALSCPSHFACLADGVLGRAAALRIVHHPCAQGTAIDCARWRFQVSGFVGLFALMVVAEPPARALPLQLRGACSRRMLLGQACRLPMRNPALKNLRFARDVMLPPQVVILPLLLAGILAWEWFSTRVPRPAAPCAHNAPPQLTEMTPRRGEAPQSLRPWIVKRNRSIIRVFALADVISLR